MCNGICHNFKVTPYFAKGSMYGQGFKFCMGQCKVWLTEEDCTDPEKNFLVCPCCKLRVRGNSRSRKTVELIRIG